MYDKALLGAAGVAGSSYAAYKLLFPWLTYDFKDIAISERILKRFKELVEAKVFLVDLFEQYAAKTPDKYFVIHNDKIYTYEYVNREANKFARMAKGLGFKKGDVVALMMNNEAALVWTLLGLLKLGITASMINTHLTHKPLSHCITASNAKAVVTSGDPKLYDHLAEIIDDIGNLPVYVNEVQANDLPACCTALGDLLHGVSDDPVDKSWRSPTKDFDNICFVFTSGTTGLPKPAILTQLKAIGISQVVHFYADYTADDILYTCLPLFHSSALYLGLFNTIGIGATIVISHFSARNFWSDCRKHKATGIQYIGELCRYLLARPHDPRDGEHCIRFAVGNGLRADIWEEFQTRFKLPNINEFFGATEGPANFVNLHNKRGAVGRYSPYMAWKDGNTKILVKYDMATAEPLRDKNGRCTLVKVGEPGLLLTLFPPYVKSDVIYIGDKKLTEKKIARDVLEKGDIYFNFGDLLYMDKDYFLYFADRIGDTFRWKGENVSTLEVANTISTLDFVFDANVYGVTVPGNDGRAGMAALILKGGEEELSDGMRKALFQQCEENLPKYARPLFIRVQEKMVLTITHKQRKVELIKEGFDIRTIPEPLYFLDTHVQNYVPLTESIYLRLLTGHAKL